MTSTLTEAINYRVVPNNTNQWWFLDPCLRVNMMQCLGICFAMFFNGYDGSLFNGLQSLSSWQDYFNSPDANTLGLMNSAGVLPGIVASFFGDFMQHFVGKRWTIWTNSVITMVGVVVMSLSTGTGMFCAGRVIMGFGTSATLAVAPAQLQEIAHPRYRAPVGALFTCTYYIAAIMSAGVCLGVLHMSGESWRIPSWLQMFGPVMTIVMTVNMPESPRWLIKRGEYEKARKVLVKHHANDKEDDELVEYEYREICAAIDEEQSLPQTSYLDFLRTPGNRHRLMILVVVAVSLNWVGNGIISYYLSPILNSLGISDTKTQLQILIGLHSWNLVISTSASIFIDKIGRRPLWLTASSGLILSMAFVMGLSASYETNHSAAIGTAVIPFLFLFYGSYDLAYTPMSYSYPIENLTFSLRTKGSAIYVATGTCAVAVNTWVNPIALDSIGWKYYGVYLGIDATLLIIQYFGFPETKNLTIEEIAVLFDGKNAVAKVHAAQGEDGSSTRDGVVVVDAKVKDDGAAKYIEDVKSPSA